MVGQDSQDRAENLHLHFWISYSTSKSFLIWLVILSFIILRFSETLFPSSKTGCAWNTPLDESDDVIMNAVVIEIQHGERRALPQHPRQAPSTFIPYEIAFQIQRGERRALPQHPRQAPGPFSPYVIG